MKQHNPLRCLSFIPVTETMQMIFKNNGHTASRQCTRVFYCRLYLNIKIVVCDSQCVLPGRKRGDELPLLGPANGGWWNTVDLTWQNGILTLNHRHSHWPRCTSRAISTGSRTNWKNIHGQANAEGSNQSNLITLTKCQWLSDWHYIN